MKSLFSQENRNSNFPQRHIGVQATYRFVHKHSNRRCLADWVTQTEVHQKENGFYFYGIENRYKIFIFTKDHAIKSLSDLRIIHE